MRSSSKRKRGVVLLIVLSLLVLFTILVVTFVVVAASYRQGAVAASQYRRVGDDPRKLLDSAAYALLRGTSDENSPFRGHELLRDMYGIEGVTGDVNGAVFRAGNQLIDLTLNNVRDLFNTSTSLSSDSGYYNGCVITFVGGEAGGVSTRIVAYDGPGKIFRVVAPYVDGATTATLSNGDRVVVNGRPFNGTGVGYNSANETTAGAALLDTTVTIGSPAAISVPVALLPNLPGHSYDTTYVTGDTDEPYDAADYQNIPLAAVIPTATPNIPSILPSFNRPALINYIFKNQITGYLTAQSVNSSLHLAVFLQPYGPDNTLDPNPITGVSDDHIASATIKNNIVALKQAMIFRPLSELNPNFDGGNLAFTSAGLSASIAAGTNPYVIGGWDVDNDGDGYTDGLWINPGFPLQTTEDGRLARPLVSVLCVDMDGKINLNTHGNWAHVAETVTSTGPHLARTSVLGSELARTPATDDRPRGQGYGPPEINPTVGTSSDSSDRLFEPTELENLLLGISTRPGRYFSSSSDNVPGVSGLDTMSARKFYDIAAAFNDNTTTALRGFQTMPDLRGELAVGLDHAGQPRWDTPNNVATTTDVRDDNPYEVNLASNGATGVNAAGASDAPFTPAELERILRINDVDAGLLPDRLAELFSVFTTDSDAPRNRRLVTTDSYDVPVPHIYYPSPWLAPATTSRPTHMTDVAKRRVRYYIDNDAALGSLSAAQRNTLSGRVVSTSPFFSPELLLGTKMDINRPFGDSRDNNGNLVVDEFSEATPDNETIDSVYVDHDNNGNTNENGYLARHYYARHLYQLMMLLAPVNGIDVDGDGTASRAETTPVLAQWAANVVDFRDPDVIMTPFEYDTHPFSPPQKGPDGGWGVAGTDDDGDGTMDNESEALWTGSDDIGPWSVDGYLGTSDDAGPERGLVWGCERPELLITETLAFHDRRVEDLDNPEEKTTRTDGTGAVIGETDFEAGTGKNDFDQALRPRGYMYVEINNPWSSVDERKPQEFYSGNTPSDGVDLGDVAGTSPIWRIAVTRVSDGAAATGLVTIPPASTAANIERVVYFTTATSGATGVAETPGTATRFNAAVAPTRVMPGRYAVVGTYHEMINENNPVDGAAGGADYVALIGRRNDPAITDKSQTRRIIMHASPVPDQSWFYVANSNANPSYNGNDAPSWLPPAGVTPTNTSYIADMLPPVTIPVSGLNISEGSYPPDDPNGDPYGTLNHLATGEPIYALPYDRPFDLDPLRSVDKDPSTVTVDPLDSDSTETSFRRIHLQRLANPLESYNVTTNPYLTIDSLEIDLTVFNGMASSSGPNITGDPNFDSRERGESDTGDVVKSPPDREFWSDGTTTPQATSGGAVADHHFNEQLRHTLGGLNMPFGSRYQKDLSAMPTATTAPTDELVGTPNSNTSAIGDPFPWLTWNNRPFVSELELMLVPKFPAWQLLQKFSLDSTTDPYNPNPMMSTDPKGHYDHLLNFFDNRTSSAGEHFYRAFEFLGVPSRFIGTETWLNKTTFATAASGTENLHPPFNRIPTFREPGRLNINTIYDARVWRALTGLTSVPPDFATPNELDTVTIGPPLDLKKEVPWIASRRGYGAANSGIIFLDDAYPTIFANPFRSSGSGRLVPLANMVRADVDCTLLRSDAILPPNGTEAAGQPIFATTYGGTHIEPDRNPYFRYESIQRLSNLVTCRSNVYAVWITIGMFEVDPVTGGLGQEIGNETGEVERHRAFYMIDRSIPVAYEPGENHNVDRAILVRRFIE